MFFSLTGHTAYAGDRKGRPYNYQLSIINSQLIKELPTSPSAALTVNR